MPREFAKVNMAIWQDGDFRRLPPPAQHLYFTLWTHPGLSYCGVVDWRPGRIAALSEGWEIGDLQTAADCLQARHFLVIDEPSEECLIRSYVRWDGLMKQPRVAVSYANAYAVVASTLIREAIIFELQQLHQRDPELAGFNKPQVLAMLSLPSVSAKVSVSVPDPFGDGFAHRFPPTPDIGLGETLPNVSPKVSVPVSVPPTTATATATKNIGAQRRATKIREDWQPSEQHRLYCQQNGIDLEHQADQFRNHHTSKGSTFKDWDAAFRTWLGNAKKWARPGQHLTPSEAGTWFPGA